MQIYQNGIKDISEKIICIRNKMVYYYDNVVKRFITCIRVLINSYADFFQFYS